MTYECRTQLRRGGTAGELTTRVDAWVRWWDPGTRRWSEWERVSGRSDLAGLQALAVGRPEVRDPGQAGGGP